MQVTARRKVAEAARAWTGVPFQHWGRTKKGVDCVGLIMGVAQELNLCPIPDVAKYGSIPHGYYVVKMADENLIRVDRKPPDLALGDVALLWGIDQGVGRHFAIIGEQWGLKTMVHAFSKQGRVVEHYWSPFWLGRFVHAYEYPNVGD